MLSQLTVINFAIVERVDLEFCDGMTVLTGETGAGKSVLIDALSLAVGERATVTNIRPGAKRADVSAVFEIRTQQAVKHWLETHHLEDLEDECILRRTVSQDGRSRAYINGRPVPVNTLRELGNLLVDIHGQHLHQSLLQNDTQRHLLDDFSEHAVLLQAVQHHFENWSNATHELDSLSGPRGDRQARLELLRYQANELKTLKLQEGEFDALSEEQRRLAHINELMTLGSTALQRLDGDGASAVVLNLQECVRDIEDMCRHNRDLEGVLSLLGDATIQVNEAVSELRSLVNGFEPDPQRLQAVDNRLSDTLDLARKHQVRANELATVLDGLDADIEKLTNSEARIETLKELLEESSGHYREAAADLHRSRVSAAAVLSRQVTEHLSHIGMSGSTFSVVVTSSPQGTPRPQGTDKIEFNVATNPGQPALSLARIVSGGELSRISLALQVVTVEGTGTPTVIFDEVDAGIGGAIAELVGHQMRTLGDRRQVLCVTHLAQVASQAHHHIQVAKHALCESIDTHFISLTGDARIDEIARMIGGVDITSRTLAHAKEMLTQVDT